MRAVIIHAECLKVVNVYAQQIARMQIATRPVLNVYM
jgi:hypothetical protein